MSSVEALLGGLPPVYEHTESLLARAAAPGPMRGLFVRAWRAVAQSPSRAGFSIQHHLRRPGGLRSWERRLVAAGLYAAVRGHRLMAAVAGTDDAEALWTGWLVRQGLPAPAGFAGFASLEQSGADVLSGLGPVERLAVGGSVPEALAARLLADLGQEAAGFLAASARRAPLTLRVNTALAEVAAVVRQLAEDELEPRLLAVPGAVGIRRCDIHAHPLYASGAVEVQDAASQAVAGLVDARPGQVVVDYCAGGGGKALALAARAGVRVWVHDVRPERLRALKGRAARAGVAERIEVGLPGEGSADRVLVDAPCSGSGTLRREPALRWRLGDARVVEMVGLQGRVLAEAARLVAPGGRLVYATCSVFRVENEGVVAAFLEGDEGFVARSAPLKMGPHTDDTDGFFAVVLERRA